MAEMLFKCTGDAITRDELRVRQLTLGIDSIVLCECVKGKPVGE